MAQDGAAADAFFIDLAAARRLLWSTFAVVLTLSVASSVSSDALWTAVCVSLVVCIVFEVAYSIARRRGLLQGDFVTVSHQGFGFSTPVEYVHQPPTRRNIVMRGGGGILCLLCACVALSSPLPLLIGLGLILLQALISLVPCFGASWYWQWRYHSENALLCCGAPPRSEEWFCLPTDVISIAASLGLQRDARVLVVGNGSSRVAELLAATCDAGVVHAVDLSAAALDQARLHCPRHVTNIVWRIADARDLAGSGGIKDFPDAHFDVVVDKGTLAALECMGFREAAKGYAECHRVLRPKGWLLTFCLGEALDPLLDENLSEHHACAFACRARYHVGRRTKAGEAGVSEEVACYGLALTPAPQLHPENDAESADGAPPPQEFLVDNGTVHPLQGGQTTPFHASTTPRSIADELIVATRMRNDGAITLEQFEAAKAAILES